MPLGQPIRKAIRRHYQAGSHIISINASQWPSGIYFYEIKVNEFRAMRRMLLAK